MVSMKDERLSKRTEIRRLQKTRKTSYTTPKMRCVPGERHKKNQDEKWRQKANNRER